MDYENEARQLAKAIGATCAAHRKARGLSQEKFAVSIGLNPKHYQTVEAGMSSKGGAGNPQLLTLAAISRGLNITIVDLINEAWSRMEAGS